MDQLNKWQKELAKLQNREYKKAETALQKVYRYSLTSMLDYLKDWSDRYPLMTFSQKREFERELNVANKLSDISANLTNDVEDVVRKYLTGTAERGYQGVMYTLEGSENIMLSNVLVNPEYVQAIIDKPVAGKRLSTRLYQNTNRMARLTEQSIIDGLWRGESYDRIAGRLRELSGSTFNNTIRVVRTEGGRIQSEATQTAYKAAQEQGVDLQKRWLATLDKKTRHDHQLLDGQTVGLDEKFHINGHDADMPRMFGIAREDINCRCTTIAIVDGIEPSLRRDNDTGRSIPYRTYSEWADGKQKLADNIAQSLSKTNETVLTGMGSGPDVGGSLSAAKRKKLSDHPVPGWQDAKFDIKKLSAYSMNENAMDNKVRLWRSILSLEVEDAKDVQRQIMEQLPYTDAVIGMKDFHGQRYETIIRIQGHDDKMGYVLAGWIVKTDGTTSLTTAFPLTKAQLRAKERNREKEEG